MKFRKAKREDLSIIVYLMANDKLGKLRENYQNPLPKEYLNAFEKINADNNQELIVVEDDNCEIVATFQLSFIPYLNHCGTTRLQIENVIAKENKRGIGIGKMMFDWAINRAKERNATIIQLTSDKRRPKALKFYENLGFKATHEGFKMFL